MTQQLTIEQLQTVLSQTLSPDAQTRKTAEGHLTAAQKFPGHPLSVLQLMASANGNAGAAVGLTVLQSAAVHFKNIVKKGWDAENEDGTDGITITDHDRNLIKSHLVELMCTAPPQIQAQCSEAISLIAAVDFPKKWDNLLPELIQKFNSPDPNIVNGVLATANSIFKRFRYINRSEELYADILYVLERIQAPLLTLFKTTGQAVDAYTSANDKQKLVPLFQSLRYMCRIFYSLNWQDLPEYFEDHMQEWMTEFSKYLSYKNPLLEDPDEEIEPSPIDRLQAAIVDNLFLYADKDEEPFIPFLPNFTTLVWNLLLGVTTHSKHDILATTCIKFLSSLVGKPMHKSLFQDESTLKQIITNIVIPNLKIREADEERFEDDPQEFIMGDMEGSDSESRRKRSGDLLKAMCRQFEAQTTSICSEHIAAMLVEFSINPSDNWIAKDAAIHLMLGISIRAESNQGVSSINDKVNIMEFFSANILTELQDLNHSIRPMVKAAAIKYASTFRNQFTKEHIAALMPLLISHLNSPNVVVHTYSASAVEKFLVCKEDDGTGAGRKRIKFNGQDLKPFLEPLFTGLFAVVDNTDWNENEYVMKCVMRTLNSAREDIINITHVVLQKLTAALFHVAKNPRNPQYNHYLFECIAILVKSVCAKSPEHTGTFEQLLFPPFQDVLQLDVAEFTPYVFQILAQLLEYKSDGSGLGESYGALLPPLLSPGVWERKGNIPALTRLLQAYVKQGSAEIVSGGKLIGMLGIFQKLVASKASETSSFDLLKAITQYIPAESIQAMFKEIFRILLMRLQQGKTTRYVRLMTGYLAQFIGQFGSETLFSIFNEMQPNLHIMILGQVWIPRLATDPPVRMEAKTQVIAMTKILCETPSLLNDSVGQQIWLEALKAVTKILSSEESHWGTTSDEVDQDAEISYDPTFSRLHFASRPPLDPFSGIQNPAKTFVTSLGQARASNAAVVQSLMQQGQQSDPKTFTTLDHLMSKF